MADNIHHQYEKNHDLPTDEDVKSWIDSLQACIAAADADKVSDLERQRQLYQSAIDTLEALLK